MSKLLGIINPNADPNDYHARWLWRSDIPWEAEQLNIEQMEVEDGNIQFRVLGPHTPKVPDGVFLKLQVNKDLNPQIAVSGPGTVEVKDEKWTTSVLLTDATPPPIAAPNPGGTLETNEPVSSVEAPVMEVNVASPQRLEGETKAQGIRRKAIALRWQASKLDKLAEDMEALEAQWLI